MIYYFLKELVLDGSLRRCDAGDGHAVGGAGYVVHAELGAELHGGGLAAVLAADADLEVGAGGTAFLDAHLNELADAFLVEHFEGIGLDDAVLLVELEELGSVVTREAEGHLGEVVGAEREEFGYFGDLVGGEGCAGNLDHCAYEVGERLALLLEYLGGGGVDDVGLVLDFLQRAY